MRRHVARGGVRRKARALVRRRSAPSLSMLAAAMMLQACSTSRAVSESEAAIADQAPVPAPRTVMDGVFTRGQAARGERRFQQTCAACHRPVEITTRWFRAALYETVADMYEQISLTMPEGNPGSLSRDEYTDIIAFILRAKAYPAGEQELPSDGALLENVSLPAQ